MRPSYPVFSSTEVIQLPESGQKDGLRVGRETLFVSKEW
jgi:hypothetical protein